MSDTPAPAPGSALTEPYARVLEQLIHTANAWGERLLGSAATEIGGILSDRVAHWRTRQAARLLVASEARLRARGVDAPREVPTAVLIPLLEAASLETEETLSKWWLELLTSASDPSRDPVHVTYARILMELSVDEVRILDWVYRQGRWTGLNNHTFLAAATSAEFQAAFPDHSQQDYELVITNLCRLGLTVPTYLFSSLQQDGKTSMGSTQRYEYVKLTLVGIAFVRACTLSEEQPTGRGDI